MFTVTWTRSALNSLASAWVNSNASVRQQITEAVKSLDLHLRQNAPRLGESRDGDDRIFHVGILGIEYTVLDLDRRVEVFRVWTIRSKPQAD